MTNGTFLSLTLICMGIGMVAAAVLALAEKKITETLSLVWGMFAFLLLLAGIAGCHSDWGRHLSGRSALFFFLCISCILAAACFISARISDLICKMREEAMQISLLHLKVELSAKKVFCGEKKKKLLLIMPAYNEEKNIGGLLRQIEEAGISKFADILVIDDASKDGTVKKVEEMNCPCVKSILHQGYAGALQTGYKYAVNRGYSYVIQIDADGQHDVCNIEMIYRALCRADESGQKPDIVLGSRFLPESRSFPVSKVKMTAINIFRLILRLATGQRITDPTTGLQGLSESVISYYACYGGFNSAYPDANTILQMLLLGYRVEEIPAVMHARKEGKSIHAGLNPLVYMLRMIFSISAVYIREKVLKNGKNKRKI